MIDFIGRKLFWKSAQGFIDKLKPAVNIRLPMDIPLPSLGLVKKLAQTVSIINGLEDKVSRLSQDDFCPCSFSGVLHNESDMRFAFPVGRSMFF